MNRKEIMLALESGIFLVNGSGFVWVDEDAIWTAPVCEDGTIDFGNTSEACATGVPEWDTEIVCAANIVAAGIDYPKIFTSSDLIDRP
jgi:hypothetical protein